MKIVEIDKEKLINLQNLLKKKFKFKNMWNLINSGYIHKYKYINKFIIMIQNKMKIKNNKISLKILFLR